MRIRVTLHPNPYPHPRPPCRYKPVGGSQTAVLLINHSNVTASLTLNFTDVPHLASPGSSGYTVRDINARADVGAFKGSFTAANVVSHDSAFLMLTPAA